MLYPGFAAGVAHEEAMAGCLKLNEERPAMNIRPFNGRWKQIYSHPLLDSATRGPTFQARREPYLCLMISHERQLEQVPIGHKF